MQGAVFLGRDLRWGVLDFLLRLGLDTGVGIMGYWKGSWTEGWTGVSIGSRTGCRP